MVMINETGREVPPDLMFEEDEEDHDGWGPIRPRRSSMPPDHPDADAHDRDTVPMICLPKKDED